MNFRITQFPSIPLRQLQNNLIKLSNKRKRTLPKFQQTISQVEIIEPYYYTNHEKKKLLQKDKCKACNYQLIQQNQSSKHNYLKSSRSYVQKTSDLNFKSKNSPTLQDKRQVGFNYEHQIRRKVNKKINTLDSETMKKFKNKFKLNCFQDKVQNSIIQFCIKKYSKKKQFQNIRIQISELMQNRDFQDMMKKEYGRNVQSNKKDQQLLSNQNDQAVQNFGIMKNFSQQLYGIILNSKIYSKEDRKAIEKFADQKLGNFKQYNRQINEMILRDFQLSSSQTLCCEVNKFMSAIQECVKGKNDEKQKFKVISNIKQQYQKENKKDFNVTQKKLKSMKTLRKSIKTTNINIAQLLKQSNFQRFKNNQDLQHDSLQHESSYKSLLFQQQSSKILVSQISDKKQQPKYSKQSFKSNTNARSSQNTSTQKIILISKQKRGNVNFSVERQEQLKLLHQQEASTNFFRRKSRMPSSTKAKKQTVYSVSNKAIGKDDVKSKKIQIKALANQFLNERHQFLSQVEQSLKSLDFKNFIINRVDSVLIKKKKIRLLREMIRKANQKQEISGKAYNEILDYLQIYEKNCRLLLDKTNYASDGQINSIIDLNWQRQKELDLKFIDLNKDYCFGQADEEYFRSFRHQNPIEKQYQYQKPKKFRLKFLGQSQQFKSTVYRNREPDLFQKDLPFKYKIEEVQQKNTERTLQQRTQNKLEKLSSDRNQKLQIFKEKLIKYKEKSKISKKITDLSMLLTECKSQNIKYFKYL